jgi:hypothetical protein
VFFSQNGPGQYFREGGQSILVDFGMRGGVRYLAAPALGVLNFFPQWAMAENPDGRRKSSRAITTL